MTGYLGTRVLLAPLFKLADTRQQAQVAAARIGRSGSVRRNCSSVIRNAPGERPPDLVQCGMRTLTRRITVGFVFASILATGASTIAQRGARGPPNRSPSAGASRRSCNLNTGGNNYDEAKGVVARNSVHHSKLYPSQITVTVVKK